MAERFELPELGEEIESAEVVGVLVSPGDEVEKDQSVIEVESDKATVEVPSPAAGRVVAVLVEQGDTIRVGQDFLELESADGSDGSGGDGAERTADGREEGRRKKKKERKKEKRGREGKKRNRKDEERAEEDDERAEEDDERAEKDGEHAEEDGEHAEEDDERAEKDGERAEEDREDAERGPRAEAARGKREAEESSRLSGGQASPRREERRRAAAPSVRRFAREIGIDVDRVPGRGPGGRVSIADVKDHARRLRELRAADAGLELAGREARPDEENVEWQELSSIRRTIGRRMQASWTTAPQVTLHADADVTGLAAALERSGEEGGPGLTAVLVKVLALSLRAHPRANARLDERGERVALRQFVHVGVAVDTDHGLMVPVLRDADAKATSDLARELGELADRARSRRLDPQDMGGGCATLTNLGGLGIGAFTPILVPGQAVILGVGRMTTVAAIVDGEIEPRRHLPLSLTFDHRILDGADAARLAGWIVRALEDPWSLLLDG